MIWGYEAGHPFEQQCALIAEANVPFYVCPGTSSWNSLTGRLDNATKNLYEAASAGANHGAMGYLVTDWGIMVITKPCPLATPDLYLAHQQVGTLQVLLAAVCLKGSTCVSRSASALARRSNRHDG